MLIRNKLVYTYSQYRWAHCNNSEPFQFHLNMKIISIMAKLELLFSFPNEINFSRPYTVKMPITFWLTLLFG